MLLDLTGYADLLTFAAYLTISSQLVYTIYSVKLFKDFKDSSGQEGKKRQLKEIVFFAVLYGLFILLCGFTHLLHALTNILSESTLLQLHTVVMVACALVSTATAVAGFTVFPAIIKLCGDFVLTDEGKWQHMETEINGAKLKYTSCVAHDLKTPLHSFCVAMALLRETDLSSEQKEILEAATVSTDLMKLTISQTMDIAKVMTGSKLTPRYVSVAVSTIIKRISIVIEGYSKQVPIKFSVAPDVNENIFADEEWIWQMLLNLLTNACKFTDTGAIDVSICLSSTIVENMTYLLYEVHDTGIGLTEDQRRRTFSVFSQLQKGASTGTGLGLYGLKVRAEAMGGVCGVRPNSSSCTGSGSVFWFAVPYRPDTMEQQLARTDTASFRATVSDVGNPRKKFFPLGNAPQVFPSSSSSSPTQSSSSKYATAVATAPITADGSSRSMEGIASTDPLIGAVFSHTQTGLASAEPSCSFEAGQYSEALDNISTNSISGGGGGAVPYPLLGSIAFVIDDMMTIRKLMAKTLQRANFEKVECFENGAKALAAMKVREATIIFSDLQMPVMSGLEMIERFRAFEEAALASGARTKRQIVIAVTANGQEVEDNLVGPNGFDKVLLKPFNMTELRETLKAYAPEHSYDLKVN